MPDKTLKFKGKTLEELKQMSQTDLNKLFSARIRRTLKRGLSEEHKKLLLKVQKINQGKRKKPIRTHLRDMPILPEMVGLTIQVHSGKSFEPVLLTIEKLGHYLGEFVLTRNKISHSAPGVGATRSSGGDKKK